MMTFSLLHSQESESECVCVCVSACVCRYMYICTQTQIQSWPKVLETLDFFPENVLFLSENYCHLQVYFLYVHSINTKTEGEKLN